MGGTRVHAIGTGTQRRFLRRLAGGTLVALVSLTGGCGSGGQPEAGPAPPPPPEPVDVSLTVAETLIAEGTAESATVEVALSQTVNRTITAELSLAGTALLDADYEASATRVSIPAGETSASVTLSPLVDWAEEDVETIEVSLGALSENATATDTAMATVEVIDDATQRPYDKQREHAPFGILYVWPRVSFGPSSLSVDTLIINLGRAEFTDLRISATLEGVDMPSTELAPQDLPSLQGGGAYRFVRELDPGLLSPDTTYRFFIDVGVRDGDEYQRAAGGQGGFVLDELGRVVARCRSPERPGTDGVEDPLEPVQWHLRNTGQAAYAESGGVAGEDLGMTQVLADNGPTGAGVQVAIVDEGLETCHPDLEPNIEPGRSFNYRSHEDPGLDDEDWFSTADPFLPAIDGDHGTSVAGLVGMAANNGVGGRGVAPGVRLRGYNVLNRQCCFEESLGMSTEGPDSSDVDIFNMSYGAIAFVQLPPDDDNEALHRAGTEHLRDGKGAIYSKAAGNFWEWCFALSHAANERVGCLGATGDPVQNLPYLVVVGAYDADGERSGYSTTGSNLWISAPAGGGKPDLPQMVTADQFGPDRGYSFASGEGVLGDPEKNPHGDYISGFNGTSAAAPNATGSIALLLEAHPELSWREVKHALAKGARKIHPHAESYEVAFGDGKTTLLHGWTTNAAGYSFHNWYGFGALAIDRTLAYLEEFTPGSLGEFVETEWYRLSEEEPIPDHSGNGLTQALTVDVGSPNADIEAVQLDVDVSHEFPAEVIVQLTSPSGTESILNPIYNNALVGDDFIRLRVLSNAFYGESPNGEWTLKVVDAAEGDTGQLNGWGLRLFHGEHD